jgi:methylglyoxal synthase
MSFLRIRRVKRSNMNIALVAHDARKSELIEWVKHNIEILKEHNLYATGTTGKMLSNIVTGVEPPEKDENGWLPICIKEIKPLKDNVTCLLSGPLGGDSQIGAMIAEGKIDLLIFFCDNLITQGHQQDVGALSRLASLYNIAFASNRTTADMIITSSLFDNPEYKRIVPSVIETYKNRFTDMHKC